MTEVAAPVQSHGEAERPSSSSVAQDVPAHSKCAVNVQPYLSSPSPGFSDSLPSTTFRCLRHFFLAGTAPSKVPMCFKASQFLSLWGDSPGGPFLPSHPDFYTLHPEYLSVMHDIEEGHGSFSLGRRGGLHSSGSSLSKKTPRTENHCLVGSTQVCRVGCAPVSLRPSLPQPLLLA